LARALPAGGQVVTLEISEVHAGVARQNLERAGVAERVQIRVGAALGSLRALAEAGGEPFDMVFIDADKPNNPGYLEWALRLTRPGSLIVVDNVVRCGTVLDEGADGDVTGSRAVLERAGDDPRLDATCIQTVGSKGWDGFILAVVGDPTAS
jgi:predicted O-methyltransferase YrrM